METKIAKNKIQNDYQERSIWFITLMTEGATAEELLASFRALENSNKSSVIYSHVGLKLVNWFKNVDAW